MLQTISVNIFNLNRSSFLEVQWNLWRGDTSKSVPTWQVSPRHRYISMLKYILVHRKCNLDIPISTFKCPLVTGFTVPQNVLQFECIQIVFKIAISPMVNLGQNIIAMIPIDFHINQNMFWWSWHYMTILGYYIYIYYGRALGPRESFYFSF